MIDSQWINAVGIFANIIGVSVVAFEWRTSIYDGLERVEWEQNLLLLADGRPAAHTNEVGPLARTMIEAVNLERISADPQMFDKFMCHLKILDSLDRLGRRRKIFTIGFAAIILGSALQLFAAWPK